MRGRVSIYVGFTVVLGWALVFSVVPCSAGESGISLQHSGFDHTHHAWDEVLKKYVRRSEARSGVYYGALKSNPTELHAYLATLEHVSREQFDTFSETEQLAFLINSYNAFTLKLIIDNFPVASIKDIGGIFSSPWKVKFFNFLGAESHLDRIEHDIIRKEFDEPRIHFALVCAAVACPMLRDEAYVANKLDDQLEDAARVFLNDKGRNRIDLAERKIFLSKIFSWFGEDFKKNGGSVRQFVAQRFQGSEAELSLVRSDDELSIGYLPYDWGLNVASNRN